MKGIKHDFIIKLLTLQASDKNSTTKYGQKNANMKENLLVYKLSIMNPY